MPVINIPFAKDSNLPMDLATEENLHIYLERGWELYWFSYVNFNNDYIIVRNKYKWRRYEN